MRFQELNLSAPLIQAVEAMEYTEMTPIQEKTIPFLLDGRDVIGKSNTGTGKTAAFSLPILEKMLTEQPDYVYALVLCPTRELAMQACDEIRQYAQFGKGIKAVAIFGGASMDRQIYQLKSGANLVVGTPGRVLDHIRRHTLKLDRLHTIVLDEADEMLDMGFREDIETVLDQIPEERQTVLFSATMPPEILAITQEYQVDPVHVEIASAHRTVDAVAQYYVSVPVGRKVDALQLLLTAKKPKSAMIFCNTKKDVDALTEELTQRGFAPVGLHGDMKQAQRTIVMNGFKSRRNPILIATDVAARGIDVKGIDIVFNFDLPQAHEYYIHRIGRTGRAGKTGTAYNILSGRRQEAEMREIARYIHAEIPEISVPTSGEIHMAAIEELRDEILALCKEDVSEEAVDFTQDLIEKTASPDGLLTALVQKMITQKTENLPTFDIPKPVRSGRDVHRTVKIHINTGRKDAVMPKNILGAFVHETGMDGKDFGKIDIHDTYSTVEVPFADFDFIMESMQHATIAGKSVSLRKYEEHDLSKRGSYRDRGKSGDRRRSRHGYNENARSGQYNQKRRKG